MFAWLTRDIRLEDLHHVFLRVCDGARGGSLAVCGNVERFITAVEEFHDIGWWGRVDDGGGDDLVYGFVVSWVRGVVDEASAAAVDSA